MTRRRTIYILTEGCDQLAGNNALGVSFKTDNLVVGVGAELKAAVQLADDHVGPWQPWTTTLSAHPGIPTWERTSVDGTSYQRIEAHAVEPVRSAI